MHTPFADIAQLCTMYCRLDSSIAFQDCTSCRPSLQFFPLLPVLKYFGQQSPYACPSPPDTLFTRPHPCAFSNFPIASHAHQNSVVFAVPSFCISLELPRPCHVVAEPRTVLRIHSQFARAQRLQPISIRNEFTVSPRPCGIRVRRRSGVGKHTLTNPNHHHPVF